MNDNKFRRLTIKYVDRYSVDFIASYLMVSCPTISRWYSGKNAPHPYMRDGVKMQLEMLDE